ncbi:AbrB/MazE/SpoVT family DNA-binding domain-containing protein [Terracidiphilus gabretensis]|jgi:antitoxin PrlF|uniref:AbrB/MazE/SpoVT family DNA-binding domain-containing protein n=1 Tax=Terracidiphilus gabretensis TaxID=1577687 RepID=UPI0009E6D49A|nr:AbrB/MazE/SpoVT family DNA-binding domain-containing protein [Terracidiphilus gabretensis]
MPSATITSKGQITLPIEVRRRLGLKQGDKVEFVYDEDGRTVVRPEKTDANSLGKLIGAFPAFKTREEIIAYWREMRGHDELDAKLFGYGDTP